MSDLQIRASAAPWARCINIDILDGDLVGTLGNLREHGEPIDFVTHDPGNRPPAAIQLELTAAQVLMDDLYAAGIRPTEGAGSAGAMAATQEHLKDLRRMLFQDARTRRENDDGK